MNTVLENAPQRPGALVDSVAIEVHRWQRNIEERSFRGTTR